MSFPCTRCGLCCRNASRLPAGTVPLREDGSCAHLTDDNLCSIYEDRPRLCRVDAENAASYNLTLEEFVYANAMACNQAIAAAGMDHEFLIDLRSLR